VAVERRTDKEWMVRAAVKSENDWLRENFYGKFSRQQ